MFMRALLVIAFLSAASAAQAQVLWSSPASACVPASTAIGHFQTVNVVGVRFSGTQTGTLNFTCQIERFDNAGNLWKLELGYRDSTGAGTGGRVLARLYKMPRETTPFAPALMVQASSNSLATPNEAIVQAPFDEVFDFDQNIYFVQVTLTRAASTDIVEFYSAQIASNVVITKPR